MASAWVSAKASWEEACLSINYLICNCPQESQFWFPLTWHISFDKCGRYSTHSHPDSKSRETNEAIQNGVTRSNLSVDQSCPTFWRMIWTSYLWSWSFPYPVAEYFRSFIAQANCKIKNVQYVLSLTKLNEGYGYHPLLFLGTTDSLPIILWWQIEIEKRRWQVLVIQWRQWENCSKERVNMTKPTLLWAGDSCLICTLSIRRVIGIGRHIFPPSWKGAQ